MASMGVRVSGWRTPPGLPGGDPAFDSNGRAEPVHFKVLPPAKRLTRHAARTAAHCNFCFSSYRSDMASIGVRVSGWQRRRALSTSPSPRASRDTWSSSRRGGV